MSKITVLTLVPNNCDRLPKSLSSVKWADDLFCVVDARACDETIALVRQYSDHVAIHEYVNAAAQRNWALPQIETEWTLVLDADEWISDALADKIKALIQDEKSLDGYDILRHSYFLGKLIKHCGWHHDYNLRLFRTRKGRYLDKRVHSKVVVEGKVGKINQVMYHDTYRTFEEYFATFQRFTTWGAQDAYEQGKRAGLHDILLRPVQRFLKMYVWRLGFLDGYHGAVLCGLSSFSVFTKYAKLWWIQQEKNVGES